MPQPICDICGSTLPFHSRECIAAPPPSPQPSPAPVAPAQPIARPFDLSAAVAAPPQPTSEALPAGMVIANRFGLGSMVLMWQAEYNQMASMITRQRAELDIVRGEDDRAAADQLARDIAAVCPWCAENDKPIEVDGLRGPSLIHRVAGKDVECHAAPLLRIGEGGQL